MNIKLIHDYIESSNLVEVVEVKLNNYYGYNYYFSIVYDKVLDRYKVLYIPSDVKDEYISRYMCLQFIDSNIDSIMKDISKLSSGTYNYKNKYIDNYLIDIDINYKDKNYNFKCSEYIPKELDSLYRIIKIIFSYVPSSVQEIGRELLSLIEGKNTYIEYKDSIEFNLLESNLDIFPKKTYRVDYLEYINGKYYSIIDNHLIILRYLRSIEQLDLYCDSNSNKYYYSVINCIRNNEMNKFVKLKVLDEVGIKYYLSYDKNRRYYKVIKGSRLDKISNNEFVIEIS